MREEGTQSARVARALRFALLAHTAWVSLQPSSTCSSQKLLKPVTFLMRHRVMCEQLTQQPLAKGPPMTAVTDFHQSFNTRITVAPPTCQKSTEIRFSILACVAVGLSLPALTSPPPPLRHPFVPVMRPPTVCIPPFTTLSALKTLLPQREISDKRGGLVSGQKQQHHGTLAAAGPGQVWEQRPQFAGGGVLLCSSPAHPSSVDAFAVIVARCFMKRGLDHSFQLQKQQ